MTEFKTYVYDDIEVRLTGRIATKEVKAIPNKPPRILKLVEITPTQEFEWKKWVPMENLYEIKDEQ